MYRHILIPTDGSPLSEIAVSAGVALARSLGAQVTAVTVSSPFHTLAIEPMMITDTPGQYRMDCEALAEKHLASAAHAAHLAGVPCDTVHLYNDHVYRAIIDTAAAKKCDLIVMASHGRRGVAALVLGSETTKVLTHSTIPVLVCR